MSLSYEMTVMLITFSSKIGKLICGHANTCPQYENTNYQDVI